MLYPLHKISFKGPPNFRILSKLEVLENFKAYLPTFMLEVEECFIVQCVNSFQTTSFLSSCASRKMAPQLYRITYSFNHRKRLNYFIVIWFSAELLVEDRIDYNELVNSIKDGSSCGDDQNNMLAGGNNDSDSKSGNFLFSSVIFCVY